LRDGHVDVPGGGNHGRRWGLDHDDGSAGAVHHDYDDHVDNHDHHHDGAVIDNYDVDALMP
jgi:hypothetical protein